MMINKLKIMIVFTISAIFLTGCEDDATIANRNISKAADNFEVVRTVSFYNTWTDTVVLQIVGVCSVEDKTTKFWVTCKNPDGSFTRHQMGRSANLTYYLDQIDGIDVTFKPQSTIPDIDFR